MYKQSAWRSGEASRRPRCDHRAARFALAPAGPDLSLPHRVRKPPGPPADMRDEERWWTFPKGHREPGETLAAREAQEEAGVSGRVGGRRLLDYRYPARGGGEVVVAASPSRSAASHRRPRRGAGASGAIPATSAGAWPPAATLPRARTQSAPRRRDASRPGPGSRRGPGEWIAPRRPAVEAAAR
ncbi:MAG: NUDIX domain-containing protein [Solirubrobacteraceae bacterium]